MKSLKWIDWNSPGHVLKIEWHELHCHIRFDQVQQIKVLSEQAEDDYLSQLQQSQQLTQTSDTWSSRAQTLLNLCFSSEAPENYQSYV